MFRVKGRAPVIRIHWFVYVHFLKEGAPGDFGTKLRTCALDFGPSKTVSHQASARCSKSLLQWTDVGIL